MSCQPVRPPIRRTAAELTAFLLAAAPQLACEPAGDGRRVLVLPAAGPGDAYTARFRAALGPHVAIARDPAVLAIVTPRQS